MFFSLILSGFLVFWSLTSLVCGGSNLSIRGTQKQAMYVLTVRLTFQNSPDKSLPSLIDATVEDLADGLGRGCFTSVDLVKVRRSSFLFPMTYI